GRRCGGVDGEAGDEAVDRTLAGHGRRAEAEPLQGALPRACDDGHTVGTAQPEGEERGAGARPPQTSCAVSTRSRSLATSSSYVTSLPSSVEANPHCGERQSWSSGRYRLASSMRGFSASLSPSAPRLVVRGRGT